MDLQDYYRKLRETAATMPDEHVIVISLATPDGGKAGVVSEVARTVAAKLVVEGRAVVAPATEAEAFRREAREMKARAEQAFAAERMQVTVISDADLRGLRERARQKG